MASHPQRRGVPACAGLVRQLYGAGVPLAEIGRRTGLPAATLYYWIDREVLEDGSVLFAPQPRRRPTASGIKGPGGDTGQSGPSRARLLARLWQAAERQVAHIEARMAQAHLPPEEGGRVPDTEKDARALALLARTLRELSAVEDDARTGKARRGKGASMETGDGEGDGDGAEVRDRDAFRQELARRLDRLRAEGEGEALPQ